MRKKLDRRTGYCSCEETKDDFGGCVPNKNQTRCIACGFRIKKSTLCQMQKGEGRLIKHEIRYRNGILQEYCEITVHRPMSGGGVEVFTINDWVDVPKTKGD